jgi:branched-chain amino acid aminotransferase
MDINVFQTKEPKRKPNADQLGFGKYYTDHMFLMQYDPEQGWHDAKIVPYAPLSIEPAAAVFHYGQECFEGMKAYRGVDAKVRLFRPDRNAARFSATCRRMCIPEIRESDFADAVKAIVSLDAEWIPKAAASDVSLYIRPCAIATQVSLIPAPSSTYLFFIVCSPSGALHGNAPQGEKIFVEEQYTRAAPGGTGAAKCGGNYASAFAAQVRARERGCDQVLWLDSAAHRYIEEVGGMNVFFKIDGSVYTAPTASGTILSGVTRMSCIELLADWGYNVKEQPIPLDQIIDASCRGTLDEAFGTGTAAVISPIQEFSYKDSIIRVGDGLTGTVTRRLYETLTGIQRGTIADGKNWTVLVS